MVAISEGLGICPIADWPAIARSRPSPPAWGGPASPGPAVVDAAVAIAQAYPAVVDVEEASAQVDPAVRDDEVAIAQAHNPIDKMGGAGILVEDNSPAGCTAA